MGVILGGGTNVGKCPSGIFLPKYSCFGYKVEEGQKKVSVTVGARGARTLRTGLNESPPSSNLAPSKIKFPNTHGRQFQSPRGLKREPAVAHSLGLQVRIQPVAWLSVSVVCCQVEVSATG